MTFKVVPVMASVVRDPQVVRNSNFVLQEPKLEALEARGRRQVFPVYTNKQTCTQLSQSATLWRSACYIAFLERSLPKVKKVQGCHCFQNHKLVNQQSEDHHNPVDASVDFEHVTFVSDLQRKSKCQGNYC